MFYAPDHIDIPGWRTFVIDTNTIIVSSTKDVAQWKGAMLQVHRSSDKACPVACFMNIFRFIGSGDLHT